VLLISLIFVALRIYLWQDTSLRLNLNKRQKIVISLISGLILGLIAGIVGIGGGVYLVPLIIVLGLGSHKEAAACGAIFVWLNSLAGLSSRIQHNAIDLSDYIPLIAAAIIGGSLGSFFGSFRFSPKIMEKILGAIIIIAIILLLKKVIVI
jgi:uncharacterized membrane protein YfcA